MNILVLGSGGREHAICWKIKKSERCKNLYCIPGNGGIEEIAICEKVDKIDKSVILRFCIEKEIDLVVIGPENYLAEGVSDFLIKNGFNTFGPTKLASKLESSKLFSKLFLNKYKIPTAKFKEFISAKKAKEFLKSKSFPLVIKADGLAAGKGVIICNNYDEGVFAINEIMVNKKFGSAGRKIIIEDFLKGFEISYFVFVDNNSFLPLGYALDHKKAYDNDKGPNTGGMGCFTPSKKINHNIEKLILEKIVKKTITGIKNEKLNFKGILFFGLMIKDEKPYVIEYNVRFGDPECQTLLRTLETDLLEIIIATTNNNLSNLHLKKSNDSVVCIVLASNGYPGDYNKNKLIENIDKACSIDGIKIFHSGTVKKSSKFFSSGGRVLSITSKSHTIESARKRAYEAVKIINWKHGFFRRDIGIKND